MKEVAGKRTPFPRVFWAANSVEVLERFAYYGIYMGFAIYVAHLGFSMGQLGTIQSFFLFFSYTIPVISGSFADRFGFKKVLLVSYCAYLPSILLLLTTKSFSGVATTMLLIAISAGTFKPLISGTIRVVTDKTNKTLGFGIFYAMVNIGGTFGPIVAGKLRAISWDYAFTAAAIAIAVMFLITLLFYKEPPRQIEGYTLGQKLKEIFLTLKDAKFFTFLVLLGIFFWMPFWIFFNLMPLYVDKSLDTARLYNEMSGMLGTWLIQHVFAAPDENGVWRILGETVANTGVFIIVFQIFVSRITEKTKPVPTFMTGFAVAGVGMLIAGLAKITFPALVFLGIALFAIGEMTCSPRIQEYITWIAPKEKAGLYMGSNFLATGIGAAIGGQLYTRLYGKFVDMGHPEYVWYMVGINFILGILAMYIFTRSLGEFKELEA